MSDVLLAYVVIALVLFFTAYVVYFYHNSTLTGKEKKISKEKEKPRHCNRDLEPLKRLIKDAVYAIKVNVRVIRAEAPLSLRPPLLLTIYPFYTSIMRVPKHLDDNPCIEKADVMQALRDLYGNDLDKSPLLHATVDGNIRYYVLLDLNEAMEYYNRHKRDGIYELI